jgi:hypothetical protein
MVRTIKATKKEDEFKQGIHLINPTREEILDAKETALAKGFRTVWLHNKRMKKLKKIL